MGTDVKNNTSPAAGEVPSRAGLAAALLSIDGIIPVANSTEANQVAAAIAGGGQSLATDPVVVSRQDARGLHRVEITWDGTTWLPLSGTLTFASLSAANTWASSNSAILIAGDRARVSDVEYFWTGSAWQRTTSARHNGTAGLGVANVAVPSGPVALPAGLLIKTGQLTSSTSIVSGDEVFPTVLFDVAFPNAALHVSITPIYQGISVGPAAAIGYDTLNVGGFVARIRGSGTSYVRSFTWAAFGY